MKLTLKVTANLIAIFFSFEIISISIAAGITKSTTLTRLFVKIYTYDVTIASSFFHWFIADL